jgi:hypothetical protein
MQHVHNTKQKQESRSNVNEDNKESHKPDYNGYEKLEEKQEEQTVEIHQTKYFKRSISRRQLIISLRYSRKKFFYYSSAKLLPYTALNFLNINAQFAVSKV